MCFISYTVHMYRGCVGSTPIAMYICIVVYSTLQSVRTPYTTRLITVEYGFLKNSLVVVQMQLNYSTFAGIGPFINNTVWWVKGGGWRFFSQIEPNWPLLYSTVPVPRLRDARPAGWVTCCSICASTMPRAQNWTAKGSTLKEDKILCPSGYIINL